MGRENRGEGWKRGIEKRRRGEMHEMRVGFNGERGRSRRSMTGRKLMAGTDRVGKLESMEILKWGG